ncbi:hypothetical protein [Aquabacterium sp. OR-4]|uniref:hypothetical protein n=1 Tax=Aquabacterium sp. OR-4 TaxID=2978127 RepID=UPI0021B49BC1|nr:hypothetical protein [Aquabacterium sp. OR-4]MDT7834998.1 hypothetical protein [Aquabacterium sp. OR-4]
MSAQLDRLLTPRQLRECLAGDAAMRGAQRARDNAEPRDLAANDELREVRHLIAQGEAQALAEHAMEDALFGALPVALLKSNEGKHSPATLVSTLLGADDPAVNDLMLQVFRLACAPHHPNAEAERNAQGMQLVREVALLLCQRFGAEHGAAYLGGAL